MIEPRFGKWKIKENTKKNNKNFKLQMINEPDYIVELYDLSLDKLIAKHGLSVRAIHVLYDNGLTNLGVILSYMYKKKGFLTLPQIGLKTERELINMCQIYIFDTTVDDYFKANKTHINSHLTLKAFSDTKKKLIDLFIKKEAHKLKTPVIKALKSLLNAPIDFNTIWDFFFLHKTDRWIIPKFGKGIQLKIQGFLQLIEDYALEIVAIDDDKFEGNLFFNKAVVMSGISDGNIEPYLISIKNRQFPIFTFVNQLFLDKGLFDERDQCILRHRFDYFQGAKFMSLEDIASQLNLTRERIRQIEVRLFTKRLEQNLAFLSQLKLEILQYSNSPMDTAKDYLHISDDFAHAINQSENCSFTPKLIAQILQQMYSDSHTLFIANPTYSTGFYLITKDLATAFNFSTFILDIRTKINEGITADTILNIDDYLSRFLEAEEIGLLTRLQDVCKHIILEEVPKWVSLDMDGHIIFQRNTRIHLVEYVVQLLEEQNEPMLVQDMLDILRQRYPKHFATFSALQGILSRETDIIIYYGERHLYGLRKWATEREDVKAGTIQQVAADYLSMFDEPVSINEVVEYVFKYRPKSSRISIYSNLTCAKRLFKLFKPGKMGLVDKTYGGHSL